MVTKTYLPCNLYDSSDISENSDSSDNTDCCDSSDSSESSDNSDRWDSGDSSDSGDRKINFLFSPKKNFFSFLFLFYERKFHKITQTQIVMKLNNSNCEETQKLKL